ncbi:UNVERIFIED_CONTAM: hypothetical protein K2H54_021511 [Gekko kuhli]
MSTNNHWEKEATDIHEFYIAAVLQKKLFQGCRYSVSVPRDKVEMITPYQISKGQPTSQPAVQAFPPSKEEITSNGKATLVCLIDGFYPGSIQVSWEAGGTAISNGVETTKPTKHNDKYMASSYLTLTPSDWEGRSSYTCKVMHEGSLYMKSVSHSQCP